MSSPDTVPLWKVFLALLITGFPLHAQSGSACLPGLPKTDLNGPRAHPIARGSTENACDPDAGPTLPQGTAGPLRFVSKAFADEVNLNSTPLGWALATVSEPRGVVGLSATGCRSRQRPITNRGATGGDEDPPSSSAPVVRPHNQPPSDRGVYYRNKLEFAFDGGWLPINIPFVFDIFMGDAYTMTPLRYTLVPLVASLRWHIDGVKGPWIFRGNWDMTVSGSITLIPRGPETRYFSYDMGIRRNFVPHRGKIAPYFDGRLGLGQIDAKEPLGVLYAQGQDFTFTVNLGSGARYNFNPRYSISAGLNWMHISNLYLSEPAFSNYGINVYGPMFGIDVRLGKPRHASE